MNAETAYWLQQALNALQLGSIYALIALGYSMVYGILSMINFAHGDVFMVGAFLCFLAGTALGLPFAPTLLLAMVGAALLGVSIERLAYKPLRNAPRVSAIITALGRRHLPREPDARLLSLSAERSVAARKRHLASSAACRSPRCR